MNGFLKIFLKNMQLFSFWKKKVAKKKQKPCRFIAYRFWEFAFAFSCSRRRIVVSGARRISLLILLALGVSLTHCICHRQRSFAHSYHPPQRTRSYRHFRPMSRNSCRRNVFTLDVLALSEKSEYRTALKRRHTWNFRYLYSSAWFRGCSARDAASDCTNLVRAEPVRGADNTTIQSLNKRSNGTFVVFFWYFSCQTRKVHILFLSKRKSW